VWAKVDDMDYEMLGHLRWFLSDGYAARSEGRRTVYLHRLILGLEPGDGLECDHKNRDRLDCQRSNLRVGSHADNGRNRGSKPGSSSRYRGVWFRRDRSKWAAQAKFDGKHNCLGHFADEDEAGRAVNEFWVSRGYDAPNLIEA
jgi:hypothetical protein